jgi:type IV secretory pathway VirB10-like protein
MFLHMKPHRRLASLSLAALVLLALSAPADAQWKWRDSRGQIHISDIPPPRDIPDKDVLQRPEPVVRKPAPPPPPAAGASAAAAPGKAPVDPELEQRKRKAEQEQEAKTKADQQKAAAIRKDNCQRARDQLATLDSGQRIARIKADGEREILDDDTRAKEARRAREAIASECR